MRKTIKVVGHMVNADFLRAEAMSAELEFTASHTPEGAFISDLCAMVRSHVYFARGDFTRTIESLGKATHSVENPNSLQNGDRIALLRLSAANAFLQDDFVELARCYEAAKKLSEIDSLKSTSYHLNCISAMVLYSHGEYHQASEMSRISILQANLDGYKTIAAPLDAMMVLARCQLEASELDQVIVTAHAIMELAQTWEIWPWYFMAQGTIIRLHITQGMLSQASEAITQQRLHVKRLSISNQLSWLVDMSELFLKLSLKDLDRINVLLSRMPAIEMVKQIELSLQFAKNPKKVLQIITAMPENTPRERIQKLLTEASAHSNHENLAFKSLMKALDLGAEYGYHEYFLRQRDLYPLIVKATTQKPTIYLENLAKDMTQRISSSNSTAGEIDKKLTNRELEILKHLNSGNPISAIAKSLHISQNTMKTHLRNTYRKLDADGRHSAVEKAKKLLLI
jgi:ATP/maltotriose-dependent transcriptional regulator MalT